MTTSDAPEEQRLMPRHFGMGALIAVAVVALALGALAGAAAGGLAGYWVSVTVPASAVAAAGAAPDPPPSLASPTAAPVATPVREPVAVASIPDPIADLIDRVSPAVVTVVNKQVAPGSTDLQTAGIGTGFVIDNQGHVVTNNHVVDGNQELQVIFADGTQAKARLLGTDSFADLAVVQVDRPVTVTLPFGDSSAVRPGDHVIAIGSALGDFTGTVTDGIVSAVNRTLDTGDGYNMEGMIQHDAPINPGNSGGPLLNLAGEVVGVNTAKLTQAEPGVAAEGLGFAIPSSTVQVIAQQLITAGKVVRPYLGISYDSVTPGLAAAENLGVDHGVVVREITPGSPAATAGVQPKDVVTKINDVTIDTQHPLVNELFHHQVGETITLELYRPSTGKTLSVKAVLAPKT